MFKELYQVKVMLSRSIDPDKLTSAEKSEVAVSVLDQFHDHQGIEVLDDFEILAFLPNGMAIHEEPNTLYSGLVTKAIYEGSVPDSDFPSKKTAKAKM